MRIDDGIEATSCQKEEVDGVATVGPGSPTPDMTGAVGVLGVGLLGSTVGVVEGPGGAGGATGAGGGAMDGPETGAGETPGDVPPLPGGLGGAEGGGERVDVPAGSWNVVGVTPLVEDFFSSNGEPGRLMVVPGFGEARTPFPGLTEPGLVLATGMGTSSGAP